MKNPIIQTSKPLTLIGGGDSSVEDFETTQALAPHYVAVDGGADTAIAHDVSVAAVIGDMDSISDQARSQISAEKFHQIAEQDSTDFDKALRNVEAPVILAIGFTGGRIDHELATLHSLARRADKAIIVLTRQDIVFVCPQSISLDLPPDTRVSLFPMRPVQGKSTGLFWPIDGLQFAPGRQSGTSNKATGAVTLEMDAPGMLCILPRRFIRQLVSVLPDVPKHARWPAL